MEPLFGWPIQILSPANVVRRRSIFLSKVDIQNPVLCEGPLSSPAFHPQLLLSGVRGGLLPIDQYFWFCPKIDPAWFDSLMEVRGRIKPGLPLMWTRAILYNEISGKYRFHKIVLNICRIQKKQKPSITGISENNFPLQPPIHGNI